MSVKVLQIQALLKQDDPARYIAGCWDKFNKLRSGKLAEWMELRNYIFATDTRSTTNSKLPWKNSTTTPKLCQIRDNLHSNYISALFPNDNWLLWEAYTSDSAKRETAKVIQGYIENKTRESHFRTEMSKMVYDYIDYGNAFCTTSYEATYKTSEIDGSKTPQYIGPRIHRISPLDIVFDVMAEDLSHTFKVVRSVKSIGEIQRLIKDEPEQAFWQKALDNRAKTKQLMGGFKYDDFQKANGISIDGFGDMFQYFMGDFVEVLEFYGDYVGEDNELQTDRVITVVDRMVTIRNEEIPSWFGIAPIQHVGWRFRSDNLWSMGPLDNLVGMQYRIDHLENAKADAFDLMIQPPLKILGDVEEFIWGPSVEIYCGEGGDVQEVSKSLNNVIGANNEITMLENKMELYAGAPRDAMGVRTPGEKTAFEVQTLMTAAGRIFQEKIVQFETELLEPALNTMLESARRNLDGNDIIRVLDTDYNSQQFMAITKEDITANGILRPIGARHFAKQQQDLQNLIGVLNGPVGQMLAPHTSALGISKFVNDVIGLSAYNIFIPNVAVREQADTASMVNQAQEDQQVQNAQTVPDGSGE